MDVDDLNEIVKREQIKILVSHKAGIVWGTAAVGLLTTAALWSTRPGPGLLIWLTISCLLAFIRWFVFTQYERRSEDRQCRERRVWGILISMLSIVNGVFWGSLTIIFFPDEPYYLALLLGLHACYISAAASSTSIYLPTFFGFIGTASAVFFLGFMFVGGMTYWPHAVLVMIYAFAIIVLGLRNNRSLTEQILLRFKNAELMDELVDQRDRAESAMLGKNRFLAAASHDLRQPVHALGLYVDSLEKHQSSEEARRILGKIRQSTASLGDLFHGLLDISKLDANVIENEPEVFSLDDLLSRLYSDFQRTATDKGLALNFPEHTGLSLYADSGLLQRILQNLLSNAVNYTDTGSVAVEVDHEADNMVRINVIDTGRGIPKAEHANIFSEYHQLENPERDRQKGLGLGLAIVRRLCDLMEIQIRVQSTTGEGSIFSIRLPRGTATKQKTVVQAAVKVDSLLKSRVVVVDDETDILDGMREILTAWGCSVIVAESTREAQVALEAFGRPDLVIADFRLRGDDSGLKTIEMIRDEFNAEIPAILITGDTAPERLQQAARASVEVMHKPVEPRLLQEAIYRIESLRV